MTDMSYLTDNTVGEKNLSFFIYISFIGDSLVKVSASVTVVTVTKLANIFEQPPELCTVFFLGRNPRKKMSHLGTETKWNFLFTKRQVHLSFLLFLVLPTRCLWLVGNLPQSVTLQWLMLSTVHCERTYVQLKEKKNGRGGGSEIIVGLLPLA